MLFRNARILPMDGPELPTGYLLTEGKTIKAVGDMQDCPVHTDSIDLEGKLILPAFIDAHSHLGMFGDGLSFEGDDGNEETDPVTPHLRAIDAVNPFDRGFSEALAAGITTVLTGPGSANPVAGEWCAIKTFGGGVDEMLLKASAGMKFALGENPKNAYNAKNQSPVTRMATAAFIREQLKKAKRYMEDLARAGEEDVDEPEYDIKCEAMIPVLKGEAKAFFHAHRADDIMTAVRIAREFQLDCVIVHATEGYLLSLIHI